MPKLTAEQKRNIRRALTVARRMGASPREQKALVEAMGVESGYRHLTYGDRDSVGVLQQRPSQGWGPAGESVEQDVRQFLVAARKANTGGGSAGRLAQAVQRSAFPGRYDERSGEADAILAQYGGRAPAAPSRGSQPGSRTVTETVTTPGVDNSGLRRQLVASFLQQGGVKNPMAVRSLAGAYGQAADIPGTSETITTTRSSRGSSTISPSGRGSEPYGGRVVLDPNADRPGVRTSNAVTKFVKRVSARAGTPVRIGTGSRHSQYTVNGNVSDHWGGGAADIPATGKRLVRLGQAALIEAGADPKWARRQKGGLYNVNGAQIIFATDEGGNHHDHLHVRPPR